MRIDKVFIMAALTITGPLVMMSFLTFRPNRLAAGQPVSLYEAGGAGALIIACALGAVILAAGLDARRKWLAVSAGLAGTLAVLGILVLSGHAATSIIADNQSFSRVSPGAGAWVALFFSGVAVLHAAKRMNGPTAAWLFALGVFVPVIAMTVAGLLDDLSIMQEYANRKGRFWQEALRHVVIAASSVGVATIIGIPVGIVAVRRRLFSKQAFFVLNIVQTIPSLALFGVMIAPLALLADRFAFLSSIGVGGIGWAPAVIALTLYSLLPIVRNTYTGFDTIPPALIDAGKGMGMTQGQLMRKVEIPIVAPVVMTGVRIAFVAAIGNTAVAALIGAGGLGAFIFQGLGQAASDLILLGAIPTIIIALMSDAVLGGVTAALKPGGRA